MRTRRISPHSRTESIKFSNCREEEKGGGAAKKRNRSASRVEVE